MAIEVLERASSPRWPTIIVEMTCNKNCDKVTAIKGPAINPILFTSVKKVSQFRSLLVLLDLISDIFTNSPSLLFPNKSNLSSKVFSVSSMEIVSVCGSWSLAFTHRYQPSYRYLRMGIIYILCIGIFMRRKNCNNGFLFSFKKALCI